MSTHATITIRIKTEQEQFLTIYNHFDGYLDHLGQMLLDHYNQFQSVFDLISCGDVSFVDSTLYTCKFYHRDRNEDWGYVAPRQSDSREQLDVTLKQLSGSYQYLFENDKWYYRVKFTLDEFRPLTQQAIDEGHDDE